MKEAFAKTKTLQSVLTHHLTQPTLRGLDQDGLERWQAILQKLDELFKPVAKEIERIMTDPGRTDEGKSVKLLAVGPKVVDSFRNVGNVLHQADESKMRLEKLIFDPLTAKPKDANEVVTFLREDAIRRSIDKGQAGIAFLQAINQDDLETVRSLLDWPGGHGISDEILRRGREAFAQRTNQTAWENLQHVEVLREGLNALALQISSWLLLLGASPASVRQSTGVSVPQSFQVEQMTKYLERIAAAKK